MGDKITLEYEHIPTQEGVRKHIKYKPGMNPNSRNGFKKGNELGKCNKGRIRFDFRKEGNPRWNGGKGITSQGYIEVITDSPNKNARGRILEHRLIMEKYLGRYLKSGEIVHHINRDKKDNRIENLELISSHSEHLKTKHKPTEEQKNKISNSLKGRIFSEEHKRNLSKSAMGNTNGTKR